MVEGRKLVCLESIVWIDITILFYFFPFLLDRLYPWGNKFLANRTNLWQVRDQNWNFYFYEMRKAKAKEDDENDKIG